MIVFGPVPSRRLGRSLGINNIPPKVCTYSCIYCQLGRTTRMRVDRQVFFPPETILKMVKKKVESVKKVGESVDYLTFVPDGEPTLDVNLGRSIEALRPLGIKIAVISNGSLAWHEAVKDDLKKADWVSLKVDSVREEGWWRINRPYKNFHLGSILDGLRDFTASYKGALATETMLVHGVNDDIYHLREIADFLSQLNPSMAYLAIPIRPPAEKWVQAPDEALIARAYQIFKERLDKVELLLGHEGNAFAFTDNVEDDILSITAVHPMRKDAVQDFLARAKADWSIIQKLIVQDQLVEANYRGQKFYIRRFDKRS
jgi:wyosine [tRNA(Phe)-imidazoG37] synthetase (radical SAM superfamily)